MAVVTRTTACAECDPDVGIAPHRIDQLPRDPLPVRGQARPALWLALGRSHGRPIARDGAQSHAVYDRHRHCGEQVGRCTQHRLVVRRVRTRGHWQRARIPDESDRRGIEGPRLQLAVRRERSTPRSQADVGTKTASDSDRKSGEPGVDAGRSRRTYTPRRSSMLALTKKRKWMPAAEDGMGANSPRGRSPPAWRVAPGRRPPTPWPVPRR